MDPYGYKWIDVKTLFYADAAKKRQIKAGNKSSGFCFLVMLQSEWIMS